MIIILLILCSSILFSQEENKLIYDGNKEYKKSNYNQAEVNYRKSIEIEPYKIESSYNLGNSLYKQEKYEEAIKQFQKSANIAESRLEKSKVYYNLGNSYFKANQLEESLEYYKLAMINNPSDSDSKYNYTYVKRLLDNNQNGNNNKDQKEENNKQDKNQEKEDQNSQSNDQSNQKDQSQKQSEGDKDDMSDTKNSQSEKNNSQKKENDEQSGAAKKDGENEKPEKKAIAKQTALRLLQAIENQEKDVQNKVRRLQIGEETKKNNSKKIDKKW